MCVAEQLVTNLQVLQCLCESMMLKNLDIKTTGQLYVDLIGLPVQFSL